jgi:hypothetical protein
MTRKVLRLCEGDMTRGCDSIVERPDLRKVTWAIVICSALMATWIIDGIVAANPAANCIHGAYLSRGDREAAHDAGAAIGLDRRLFFLGFTVSSMVWLMRRPKGGDVSSVTRRSSAA